MDLDPYQRDAKWRAFSQVANREWASWRAARERGDRMRAQDHAVAAYRAEELADIRRMELQGIAPTPTLFERWATRVVAGEDPFAAARQIREGDDQ